MTKTKKKKKTRKPHDNNQKRTGRHPKDTTRHDTTRHDTTRHDKIRQEDKTSLGGKARYDGIKG